MKKVIFALAAVALLASCKKQYTCNCTTTDNFNSGGTPDVSTFTMSAEKKKKDAEGWCSSFEGTSNFAGWTSVTTCDLK